MGNQGIINSLSSFGRYLKIELLELNKTQSWLAKEVKIDASTISNLVRGCITDDEKVERIKTFLENYKQSEASKRDSA